MSAPRDLDAVLKDLAATIARLDAAESLDEKVQLRASLHELRAEAAAVRGPELAQMSDTALRAAIGRVRRGLDELRAGRFDPSMVAGASGFGGGLDPLQTIEHNQAVDAAGGRARLESELAALTAELEGRHR